MNKNSLLLIKIKRWLKDIQAKYDELSKVASPVVEDEYLWG